VTVADGVLIVWIGVMAAQGFFRGFAAQILSIAGVAIGAFLGSWIAPHAVPGDSTLASLIGALTGAVLLGAASGSLVGSARRFVLLRPSLRLLDSWGGAIAGAVVGLGFAWLAGVFLLHEPSLGLRPAVQGSAILPRLLRALPPDNVLSALDRFDALPLLPGVEERLPDPDPSVLSSRGARAAAASVVKVEGTSCGLGAQGSGWVVRRNIVATNAHVIAGQGDTQVLTPGGQSLGARPVYVDAVNDVALLRVNGLRTSPLATREEDGFPKPVVLLGYPRDGALTAVAGTAGEPRTVLAPDAYRRRVRPRQVVPLRGSVEPGESGGPVIDRRGAVVAMIFGGTRRGEGGFGVPVELVLHGLDTTLRVVSPGPCVG
jgi:S1-C subfamily serine protease